MHSFLPSAKSLFLTRSAFPTLKLALAQFHFLQTLLVNQHSWELENSEREERQKEGELAEKDKRENLAWWWQTLWVSRLPACGASCFPQTALISSKPGCCLVNCPAAPPMVASTVRSTAFLLHPELGRGFTASPTKSNGSRNKLNLKASPKGTD